MVKQTINVGAAPNDGTGDPLRTAMIKANDNFTELYLGGDPLNLTVTNPAAPPAGTVRVFRKEIAGRQLPAFIGPSGAGSALQPLLAQKKIGYWSPPGNATTLPGVFGFNAVFTAGFTTTARNVAATNMFTRMRRLGYQTSATAGTVGQWTSSPQYTTGDGAGLGGFTYILRFGISDPSLVAGARMFMGARQAFTPTNLPPANLTNCIGVGHDAGETELSIYYGGTTAQAPIPLGVNFPVTTSTDPYELALFSSPASTDINWEVTNLRTGNAATGTVSGGAAVVPTATVLLAIPWGFRTNNATASIVGIDVMSAYIETEQ